MTFHKRNKLQQLLLKMKSSEAYYNYRFEAAVEQASFSHLQAAPGGEAVHFLHSGNAGDIVYAVPAMQALAGSRAIHLYLQVDQPSPGKLQHPLGNVMLNRKMVDMLAPLLLACEAIAVCKAYEGETIHYDLDLFRRMPLNHKAGSIPRWYLQVFGAGRDLTLPWLRAPVSESFREHIVVARSSRYRNPGIDYSFLNGWERLLFVGVKEEYEAMKQVLPNIVFHPVNDFLQLASVIGSARLFIGNQSLPFAIAEGLKARRLLEVYHRSPNVIPEGPGGYDFYYQPVFEKLVHALLSA